MTTILETERLLLKPYKDHMAEAVYEVVRQKEIADMMLMIPHPYPRKQVDGWLAYLQKSFELGSAYEYAVFTKEEPSRYIGNCGLVNISQTHQSGEIGYFIDSAEWGKGYATEACRKLVEIAFTQHGLNRLFGRCLVRNPASRNVLQKAGMAFEGRFKQEFRMNGVYEDTDYLAILAIDYEHTASVE
ncbi:GNAT family N-acetyltransferase [Planococcus sp. ISL-109]|uniref:GNAT family N-acetyltransferase n=1 Tax=Planococcus sp. ISL-109 TaxID=2819166 RepID=UPI001BE6FB14|nr:GNAT family N-acetyltransferase [Planococcus sp. ISL-109]MBT2582193.1 GNAT family N-acetyltransferase [Planococcus sp. ISL-109]